ncbi:hypothetical protein [Hoeflea sp. YIM 152468]|uniref:hypothetical protein n=1 Tax=Hoeflea sp. YIM 152468 TaxID=3031759 RepID=UPI0023DBDC23|nr:hypothetical protein [Hoeflea sp. YIM 152468]
MNTDQTVTLLKIQALLAGAYELSQSLDGMSQRADTRFMSYLIRMARMEVRSSFENTGKPANASGKGDNFDR